MSRTRFLLKIILLIAIVSIPRVYNLDQNGHYFSDESRDLVNIHQIFVEKNLTLVGPISDLNTHVYSSMTYYLLLPFAIAGKFEPISTISGAAFYGIATALLLIYLLIKFRHLFCVSVLFIALWWPLVEISRWPWNPNFVPFWISLGLIMSSSRKKIGQIASGVCFGLLAHHHYTSLISTLIYLLKKHQLTVFAGISIAIVPFIVFDLLHPPGLFYSTLTAYNSSSFASINLSVLPFKTVETAKFVVNYFFSSSPLWTIGTLAGLGLIISDLKKRQNIFLIFAWIAPLCVPVIYSNQPQYLLSSLPFFIIWLFKRRPSVKIFQFILASSLILSSLPQLANLRYPAKMGSPRQITQISDIILNQINAQSLKNPNLAVLASPDIYTNGKKYRDQLLVRNVKLLPLEELYKSDNLFVITTSNADTLRKDPALEMHLFRQGPVYSVWEIPQSKWKLIQFNKY